MRHPPDEPERTFTALYRALYPDLVRFVQRRAHPDHAEDVAAEALMVVWRRLDEVPRDRDDARAWVFGITRHVLLNERRGSHRRDALRVRLTDTAALPVGEAETDAVLRRVDVARAWGLLSGGAPGGALPGRARRPAGSPGRCGAGHLAGGFPPAPEPCPPGAAPAPGPPAAHASPGRPTGRRHAPLPGEDHLVMIRTHDVDAALRALDPGAPHVDPAGPRARADLDRILATDRSLEASRPARPARPAPGRSAERPPRRARTTRRLVLAGAVLATATAGTVVLPAVTGGGDQAFASWTASPDGMTPVERVKAVNSCRKDMKDSALTDPADELDRAMPAIAERRGVWDTVVLAGPDGFSALCTTDSTAGFLQGGMVGYLGATSGHVAPGPHDLSPNNLGVGAVSSREFSMAVGEAGTEVTGVLYRSITHGDVTATVSGGYFALWFPGDELGYADSTHPVEVEVTYADGTTAPVLLTLG